MRYLLLGALLIYIVGFSNGARAETFTFSCDGTEVLLEVVQNAPLNLNYLVIPKIRVTHLGGDAKTQKSSISRKLAAYGIAPDVPFRAALSTTKDEKTSTTLIFMTAITYEKVTFIIDVSKDTSYIISKRVNDSNITECSTK